jgi:hypothetical protein
MTERRIDDAIDSAVRDMMTVDADSAFRARVLARLVSPGRASIIRGRMVAALAGAAAVALAVLLTSGPAIDSPDLPVRPPSPVTAATVPAAVPGAPIVREQRRPARGAARSRDIRPSPAATHVVPSGSIVATVADVDPGPEAAPAADDAASPLAAPDRALEPIAIAPLSTAPLSLEAIAVAPLSIVELQVEPLMRPQEKD